MKQAEERTAAGAIGVIIVAFASEDVIVECLDSLMASVGVQIKVVVVDNASPDRSGDAVLDWASGTVPFARPATSPLPAAAPIPKPIPVQVGPPLGPLGPLTLIRSAVNRGFAGGVNLGLAALAADTSVGCFWILNPDTIVPPGTARAFHAAAAARPDYALMTGRTVFYERPDEIQSDGGWLHRRTGQCVQVHRGRSASRTPPPDSARLDWVTGANMVASRAFLAAAGPMAEDFFLFYEEVDWATRRGALPLVFVPGATVFHRGGTAIGSGTTTHQPSAFADYFLHRNQVRFMRRQRGRRWPASAVAFGLARAMQRLLRGQTGAAWAILAGVLDLPPPRAVAARITDPAARQLAFGRPERPL